MGGQASIQHCALRRCGMRPNPALQHPPNDCQSHWLSAQMAPAVATRPWVAAVVLLASTGASTCGRRAVTRRQTACNGSSGLAIGNRKGASNLMRIGESEAMFHALTAPNPPESRKRPRHESR